MILEEKKILVLYLDGYSYQQIATDCGVAKKSVDNGLSRIRTKLFYLLESFVLNYVYV